MNTQFELIRNYCNTLKQLFERHGVNFDRIQDQESLDWLEESVILSERILRRFHLPNSANYLDMLPWEEVYQYGEDEIYQLIAKLESESRAYFEEVAKPELLHLKESVYLGYKAEFVLADMGLPDHPYLNFVYNQILCKNYDTIQHVLQELKNTGTDPHTLKNIALAGWSTGDARQIVLNRLLQKDISYLHEFLDYQDTLQYKSLQAAVIPIYTQGTKTIFIENTPYEEVNPWCIIADFSKDEISGPENLNQMLHSGTWYHLQPGQREKFIQRLISQFDANEIFNRLILGLHNMAA